jgi:hypothetical protein
MRKYIDIVNCAVKPDRGDATCLRSYLTLVEDADDSDDGTSSEATDVQGSFMNPLSPDQFKAYQQNQPPPSAPSAPSAPSDPPPSSTPPASPPIDTGDLHPQAYNPFDQYFHTDELANPMPQNPELGSDDWQKSQSSFGHQPPEPIPTTVYPNMPLEIEPGDTQPPELNSDPSWWLQKQTGQYKT